MSVRLWITKLTIMMIICGCWSDTGNAQEAPVTHSVSDATAASHLKLVSWNIRIFSKNRTDEQLRAICRIAKQFDFIAIVELRDEIILSRMVKMLKSEFGRNYAYEISPPVGNIRKELYAFVYDVRLVSVKKSGRLYKDSKFFRYPYYATFKAGSFDFTVLVSHIIWGDSVSARRREINRLAYVYQKLQDADLYENDLLFMGDFNRDPNDDLAWGPMLSLPGMVHIFSLPEKSMIWDSHLYDNIWFQSTYVREYTMDRGIIRFDESDYGNNDKAASKDVSDHRPIWSLFRIDGPDDD